MPALVASTSSTLRRVLVLCLLVLVAGTASLALPRAARAEPPPDQGAGVPELLPPGDLTPLAGLPITRIEVTTVGGRWPSVPSLKRVKPGEPLAPEVARRAVRELLESGAFAEATVEAEPDGPGVRLRIRALPRRLVATAQLAGGVLDHAQTLEAAGVAVGGELTAPRLQAISRSIRELYRERGYFSTRVDVDTSDTDDPMKVVLSIEIAPGPARTVAQRVFIIDPRADKAAHELRQTYRVGAGDRLDQRSLAEANRELLELLQKSSFPEAKVRHSIRHVGPHSYLYVHVEPGPRVVVRFEGNRAFDAPQLEQALGLEEGGELKPGDRVDVLRAHYVERGFLDVEIAVRRDGRPTDPVHHLVFSIRENRQVRVVRRLFPCLGPDVPPAEVGGEIQSFLEEELPGAETFSLPDGDTVDRMLGPREGGASRARPLELNPAMTYAPETYERALRHLRDLFHSRGFLNAVVGPVQLVRARCAPGSPPGECIPVPPAEPLVARCPKDPFGLPLPEPPPPDSQSCRPDPERGLSCAPELTLRIPIHLGPQTVLYDVAFEGNRALTELELAVIGGLVVGQPLSSLELEQARIRVLDAYKDRGHAYAEVRTVIEPSPDRTRARARFVVAERELVVVSEFVLRGATRTDRDVILRRLALTRGEPYRQSQVRASEERIAALGTFSSVSLGLEDPEVPQRQKRVIVTVVEQMPQYLDPRIGFSTGEGLRFAFEYGHRNIGGQAIQLTLRVQLSYLFDFMILDPGVRENLGPLSVSDRLERRNTASLLFPEVGLGPFVSLTLDGVDMRDNQRDFGLTRQAFITTVSFRPRRGLATQLGASSELNDVQVFNAEALERAVRLLRVPQGRTIAFAQRVGASLDGRDNPFAATRGAFASVGVEHVNAFPSTESDNPATIESHFLRLTGRVAGYLRLTKKGTALALSMSGGYNLQLASDSQTYPDRLFFLGGVNTIRGFLADSMVPEDVARRILEGDLEITDVAIRGGDVALNPRVELRVPLNDTFDAGFFVDAGNLWVDPSAINLLALRYAGGAGLRVGTPIGPLALDYGINLLRRPWEDFGAIHFSIGLF